MLSQTQNRGSKSSGGQAAAVVWPLLSCMKVSVCSEHHKVLHVRVIEKH